MRTSTAIAILCVFMAGCQKDPAPAPASTAPPVVKPDAGLKDLLKRADAVTPKDAPDTLRLLLGADILEAERNLVHRRRL